MLKYFFTNDQTSHVDSEIDAVLLEMQRVGVLDESYPKLMALLERLEKIKASNRREKASRDTWVNAVASVAGVLVIVAYEQKHVFTSRGITHIIRPKGT